MLLGGDVCTVDAFPDPVDCAVVEDTGGSGPKAMEGPGVDELASMHVSRRSNLKIADLV